MASSASPNRKPAASAQRTLGGTPELEDEVRAALEDLENGDYIELTPDQLERCIETGESPWRDESRG